MSKKNHKSSDVVVNFYEFMGKVFPESQCRDMTEGIYNGDPNISYEEAQKNQINYLLDEIGCKKDSRILDIGCGHGALIEEAKKRGAIATGITITPSQVRYCRERGLDARLLNYRNIGEDWNDTFDGVIANGSMEHFVQPDDVVNGKADELYREFFEICHRIIRKQSESRRLATTVIHYNRYHPSTEVLKSSPFKHKIGSDDFNAAYLEAVMGGTYPITGQLAKAANGNFDVVNEVDGTEDYRLTSDEWLKRSRVSFTHPIKSVKMLVRLFPHMVRRPKQCFKFLGLLFFESWQWQFRGDNPPTRLLRNTWEYK